MSNIKIQNLRNIAGCPFFTSNWNLTRTIGLQIAYSLNIRGDDIKIEKISSNNGDIIGIQTEDSNDVKINNVNITDLKNGFAKGTNTWLGYQRKSICHLDPVIYLQKPSVYGIQMNSKDNNIQIRPFSMSDVSSPGNISELIITS